MLYKKSTVLSVLCLASMVLAPVAAGAEEVGSQDAAVSTVSQSGLATSFNLVSLKANQYDSLVGTWQDELGGQMGIRADGHLYTRGANGGYLTLAGFDRQTETGSLLFKLMGQPDNQPTSIKLELVSAGQAASAGADTSDQTKDRLILSGTVYYKVSATPYWDTEEFKAALKGEEVSEKAAPSTSEETSDVETPAQETGAETATAAEDANDSSDTQQAATEVTTETPATEEKSAEQEPAEKSEPTATTPSTETATDTSITQPETDNSASQQETSPSQTQATSQSATDKSETSTPSSGVEKSATSTKPSSQNSQSSSNQATKETSSSASGAGQSAASTQASSPKKATSSSQVTTKPESKTAKQTSVGQATAPAKQTTKAQTNKNTLPKTGDGASLLGAGLGTLLLGLVGLVKRKD